MDRCNVLSKAVEECMQSMYALVQPKTTWEEFIKENEEYRKIADNIPKTPAPYEFYYLSREKVNEIVEEFESAYAIGSELYRNLDSLIGYFEKPIRDKYIPTTKEKPGYRDYEEFTPLKEIIGEEHFNKVIDYIKEAKNFWNRDWERNSFEMTVYLGASPNSNKEAVIENWKKYRGQNITINDETEKD